MDSVLSIWEIQDFPSYLSNKFPLPVHAQVASTLRTSYPHSTAEGIRFNKKPSCHKKREESQGAERTVNTNKKKTLHHRLDSFFILFSDMFLYFLEFCAMSTKNV